MYLTKAFSHSILERNSLCIAISLLTVDIISQKPPFFNILRLLFTFISKKQKISRLNRLIYCEMIFTFLFSLKSLVVILSSGSTEMHYGANKQNRTADLRVTNPLLYQLSYIGKYSLLLIYTTLTTFKILFLLSILSNFSIKMVTQNLSNIIEKL